MSKLPWDFKSPEDFLEFASTVAKLADAVRMGAKPIDAIRHLSREVLEEHRKATVGGETLALLLRQVVKEPTEDPDIDKQVASAARESVSPPADRGKPVEKKPVGRLTVDEDGNLTRR